MTERRLDSQSPGLGEDSQSRRGGRSAARSGCALAATLLLATSGFAAEPENLAPQARVSATSEYSADYAARFAIDGLVPEALSRQDIAQAWCINRMQAGDQGEFTLRWKQPIEVAEIVYFGRTAQLLSECWKDYEVYLDDQATPAARGTFQMAHGPQRIPLEPRRVQQVRLKFLNSYGPYNPGASEIAVYAARPSDEQLARFPEPPDEPLAGPPWIPPPLTPGFERNPYELQVDAQLGRSAADKAETRRVAIENLSLMRAYRAADQVAARLTDSAPDVRRAAAICLGRIGGRRQLERLLATLDDESWSVRQAAWIALSNLTGQEFPFDALAPATTRAGQTAVRRQGVATFRADDAVSEFVALSTSGLPWLRRERLAKALGASGDRARAVPALVSALQGYTQRESNDRAERLFVQACIRALGRLGGSEAEAMLIALLPNPCWAVYAADALGDVGSAAAAVALLQVLPDYAYAVNRADRLPALHHGDGHSLVKKRSANDVDFSGGGKIWTPRTAYAILLSLCRCELASPQVLALLRKASPQIVANMPLDYDGISVYDVEPWEPISAFLLERAGLRQGAVDAAFQALGQARQPPADLPYRRPLLRAAGGLAQTHDAVLTPFASKILLSCCRASEDVPLLIALLKHDSHWVRINAAKTLIALRAKEAVAPLCQLLEAARDDAAYGYFGGYGQPDWKPAAPGTYGNHSPWYIGADEYNDPSPRYKEAFLRALGRLGDDECVPLLVRYLNNERNAMEIAHAAVEALADLRTPAALTALHRAECSHPSTTCVWWRVKCSSSKVSPVSRERSRRNSRPWLPRRSPTVCPRRSSSSKARTRRPITGSFRPHSKPTIRPTRGRPIASASTFFGCNRRSPRGR